MTARSMDNTFVRTVLAALAALGRMLLLRPVEAVGAAPATRAAAAAFIGRVRAAVRGARLSYRLAARRRGERGVLTRRPLSGTAVRLRIRPPRIAVPLPDGVAALRSAAR